MSYNGYDRLYQLKQNNQRYDQPNNYQSRSPPRNMQNYHIGSYMNHSNNFDCRIPPGDPHHQFSNLPRNDNFDHHSQPRFDNQPNSYRGISRHQIDVLPGGRNPVRNCQQSHPSHNFNTRRRSSLPLNPPRHDNSRVNPDNFDGNGRDISQSNQSSNLVNHALFVFPAAPDGVAALSGCCLSSGGSNTFGDSIGDTPLVNTSTSRVVNSQNLESARVQNDVYVEHPIVSRRSEEEVSDIRQRHEMTVTGVNIPRPVVTFKEANFPGYLNDELQKAFFTQPTPIQMQCWPIALSGRDMVGIAKTGSGKTLAFILPAIVHVNVQPVLAPGDGPIVLILVPTHELAQQTLDECRKFGHSSVLKSAAVCGGVSKKVQGRPLREGIEILIATPSRLIDFLEQGDTNLKRVTYLVLDEADRMIDMGFEPQIRKIVRQTLPDRQTLFWCTSWSAELQKIDYVIRDIMRIISRTLG